MPDASAIDGGPGVAPDVIDAALPAEPLLEAIEEHGSVCLVVDPESLRIVAANRAAAEFYGWSRAELCGMVMTDLNTLSPEVMHHEAVRAGLGEQRRFRMRHRRAGGAVADVEVGVGPVVLGGRRRFLTVVTDLSHAADAERTLARLHRLFTMLSDTTRLVVGAADRQAVFEGACRIAVERGGFLFAWVGIAQGDEIVPVASFGDDHGYVREVHASLDALRLEGRGPTATCIRTGRHVAVNDFLRNLTTSPWRARAERVGIGASAAFPLRCGGRTVAALNLYSGDPGFFTEPELDTLDQIADDLSFGLEALHAVAGQREAERRLAESVERLAAAESLAGVGAWSLDLSTGRVEWSPEMYRIMRTTPERFTHDVAGFRALLHPEDRPLMARAHADAVAAGRESTITFRVIDGDRIRHVESRAQPVPDADGVVRRFSGAAIDVTDRVERERYLRETAERLQLALTAAEQGTWDIDCQTGAAVVSDEYARMLGEDPAAFVETNQIWRTRLHPEDVAPTVQVYEDYVAGRIPEYRVEFRMRTAAGGWRWILSLGRIIEWDPDGSPRRMIGTHTDITRLKEVEASLRLRSAALDAAALAIFITDADGRIEWSNPAFESMTGWSPAETIGRTPGDLLRSGRQDRAFYDALWTTIRSGRVWEGEIVNRRRDGSEYPELLTITPVRGPAGAVSHFVAIMRDLTESRQLQQRLAQSQKLESIGRLAGGVAHDFNNLLTVINGTLDLTVESLRADDPLRHELADVRQAGARAEGLTRQLLAFSRQQVLRPEALQLNDTVADLARMLRRLLGEEYELALELGDALPPVMADVGQLEQVIVNLVVNARDAMPSGGTVSIATAVVVLDAATLPRYGTVAPGRFVRLCVRDRGIGMSGETLGRLFEPFFTTKPAGKGTGLGLATSYGIVQQSGGAIDVDSTPGVGTTFHIYLPAAADSAAVDRPRIAMSDHVPPSAGTVLVVDDEPGLRMIAERILRRAGFDVLTAASGDEAIATLASHDGPVHLLMTDVVMPGMSGPALAETVRERHPTLRVLFTSGYTDDDVIHHGLDGGRIDFIGKPYSVADLTAKVREVLAAPR